MAMHQTPTSNPAKIVSIPTTMRAIIQTGPGQSSVKNVAVPQVQFGSVLVKVEAMLVHPNALAIYNAKHPFIQLPYPLVPGSNAVGRVVVPGPDATSLRSGQLVIVNTFVRARDDPSVQVLWGIWPGTTPETNHLYTSTVRDGVCAEYVLAPLENTFALNEDRLLGSAAAGGLGYQIPDLLQLAPDTILYAGLRSIDLQAGERIIVTPATGHFSAAAVDVAVAMGASVIAASRNATGLAKLKQIHPSIETVELTCDLKADTAALESFGNVDAVIDVSPPSATGSSNLAAAVATLHPYGRVSLAGGRMDEALPIPYMVAAIKNLTIRGLFMFRREDQRGIIKLAESGLLKIGEAGGHTVVASYDLDSYSEALSKAVEISGPGNIVCLKP